MQFLSALFKNFFMRLTSNLSGVRGSRTAWFYIKNSRIIPKKVTPSMAIRDVF